VPLRWAGSSDDLAEKGARGPDFSPSSTPDQMALTEQQPLAPFPESGPDNGQMGQRRKKKAVWHGWTDGRAKWRANPPIPAPPTMMGGIVAGVDSWHNSGFPPQKHGKKPPKTEDVTGPLTPRLIQQSAKVRFGEFAANKKCRPAAGQQKRVGEDDPCPNRAERRLAIQVNCTRCGSERFHAWNACAASNSTITLNVFPAPV
jgi:hypothetical protein